MEIRINLLVIAFFTLPTVADMQLDSQDRIAFNHPGLIVDLGVGLWAWPLPMDWDGDGDLDLVVSCPDVPFNGTYFFENRSNPGQKMPVFEPPVRVGQGLRSPQVSYFKNQTHVLTAGIEWTAFRKNHFSSPQKIYPKSNVHPAKRLRANQWKYCDFDGDGVRDLLVGVGDWSDYGWDNAFDTKGNWTNGPLRGFVYWIKNENTNEDPRYANPVKVLAQGRPIEVFGMPSPSLDDFDSDGDLDILCGEFLDGFTFFENVGNRTRPTYKAGVRLTSGKSRLKMDLQMITPTSIDWDDDGDIDLICGDEDGRVAFIENQGLDSDRLPEFSPPRYFQQRSKDVKFGALVTPVSVDWDGDGDADLICGNTAGYIGLIENLGFHVGPKGDPVPIWDRPRYLEAEGEIIRIQAGNNGSIQGPAEAKWGYTTLSVGDWDHDGLLDLVVNSIWGKVVWFKNVGSIKNPRLSGEQPIHVDGAEGFQKPSWNWWTPSGKQLVTQWRTTPVIYDINEDGLNDLVMLDPQGYLAWFEREQHENSLRLLGPNRLFKTEDGKPLRLNSKPAGGSGRRKFCLVDWNVDGKVDLLVNGRNVDFYENVSKDGKMW
ncbi:MAG: VCBS repeat-containing protein, partial [Planctomycetota bacterium]|nr:VCBS repeat-containing protein [Planctomycetota bacterium]